MNYEWNVLMAAVEKKVSPYLYRIVKFEHVVEILNGSLHFSHPSKWDDPYETRVKNSRDYAMFAQCWTRKAISDAMWRIYSPDHLGVRIRTTREKLTFAMKDFARRNKGYKLRLANVQYDTTVKVREKTLELAKSLEDTLKPQFAADLLFHKRNAFSHEREVRAVIFCPTIDPDAKKDGIKIDIDGHELIESIFFDPRAADVLVEALKNYLKNVMDFSGDMRKSSLYSKPQEIIIDETL